MKTLFLLWRYWRRCSEQRLLQLIDNSLVNAGSTGANMGGHPYDPFTLSDEAVTDRVQQFVRRRP